MRRDRPRRRAADKRGELAAVHSAGLEVDDHFGACMVTEFCLTEAARAGQNSLNDRPKVAWRTGDRAEYLGGRRLLLQRLGKVPRTPASSRVHVSSCFFTSLSELGLLLTRAFAFVPVERSLRACVVGLLAPLRDKVTSSAQSLVPLCAHRRFRTAQESYSPCALANSSRASWCKSRI